MNPPVITSFDTSCLRPDPHAPHFRRHLDSATGPVESYPVRLASVDSRQTGRFRAGRTVAGVATFLFFVVLTLFVGLVPVPTNAAGNRVHGDRVLRGANNDGRFDAGSGGAGLRVGGRFWVDLNNDGRIDAGEPGIAEVEVQVWKDDGDGVRGDGDGVWTGGRTTADGDFVVHGLPAGSYFVVVPFWNFLENAVLSNRSTSTGNDPAPDPDDDVDGDDNGESLNLHGSDVVASGIFTLTENGEPTGEDGDPNSNLTIDFGFRQGPLLSVGNRVWRDLNGDGVRQSSEPGIGGVMLVAIPEAGGSARFDWTDSDGLYQFTGLPAGRYFIRVESSNFQPGGALFGLASSPGIGNPDDDVDDDDDGLDGEMPAWSGIESPAFTLADETEPLGDGDDADGNQTIDFGFFAPPNPAVLSLGGTIWKDENGDGLRQSEEPGVGGVTVLLRAAASPNFVPGVPTDDSGHYRFDGLPAGDYAVEVPGWTFDSGGSLYGRVSSPGATDGDDDVDDDDNGVDQSVPRLFGIRSEEVTLVAGAEPPSEVDGDGPDGNQTLDFGFYVPADPPTMSVGGTIFDDANANGIRDPGEGTFSPAIVSLFRRLEDGAGLYYGTVVTDPAGVYRFSGLTSGRYFARVEGYQLQFGWPLADRISTPGAADADLDVAGDDNGIDSPAPEIYGVQSRTVTLAHGTEPDLDQDGDDRDGNLTIDFAFMSLPEGRVLTLGGTVFGDDDDDGRLDESEAGIGGVWIECWMDDGDGRFGSGDPWVGSMSTAADGGFAFGGLVPGDYLVAIARINVKDGPLAGRTSSVGNDPAPDPDDDVDGDDNGSDVDDVGPAGYGVATKPVTLRPGGEPTHEDGDPHSNLTLDLGFAPAPKVVIGGTIFRDENDDGVFDPGVESGIGGIVMEVWVDRNADGRLSDGDTYAGNAFPDASGNWTYDAPSGDAYLAVISRFNFKPFQPLHGLTTSRGGEPARDPDDDVDGDDNGEPVTLFGWVFYGVASRAVTAVRGTEPTSEDGNPDTNLTLDFGFRPGHTLSLGNQVFHDTNLNGRFDPESGETGVPPFAIYLYGDNGDGVFNEYDEFWDARSTNPDGTFLFSGLTPGDYLVVVPPEAFAVGAPLNGHRPSGGLGPVPDPDEAEVDGDNNAIPVRPSYWILDGAGTRAVTLREGAEPDVGIDGDGTDSNLTVDLGFVAVPGLTVGGTVFEDQANDGRQDGGDSGIGFVGLNLWADNGDGVLDSGDSYFGSTVSDDSGRYSFGGLPAGQYLVVIPRYGQPFGGPLAGMATSTGNDPAGDPDDDVDGDDNGRDVDSFGQIGFGVASMAITLADGTEPGPEVDGDDTSGNATVDFGFRRLPVANFVVNSVDDHDDGVCDAADCTLREALTAANVNPGKNTITFAIPGAGPFVIRPGYPLPVSSGSIVLDATSQPGYAGTPVIVLQGDKSQPWATGLLIEGGDTTIRGFAIHGFASGGIQVRSRGGNRIESNYLGLDHTGSAGLGNGLSPGLLLLPDAPDNVIVDNVVSANFFSQIDVRSARNMIQGNRIGTDATGTIALSPATSGITLFDNAHDNLIGGVVPGDTFQGARNLISGLGERGIAIGSATASRNRIVGNWIGTDITGAFPLAGMVGIDIGESSGNTIGGVLPGEGNRVAHHSAYGIGVFGDAAVDNAIRGNSIFDNGSAPGGGAGIDLFFGQGPTPNDPGDFDGGPNRGQNHPIPVQVTTSPGTLQVEATLDSMPDASYVVDVYSNAACDASGYGEGEVHLGWTVVTTDGQGRVGMLVSLPVDVAVGRFVTLTATDVTGSTSEFSPCREVMTDAPPTLVVATTRGQPDHVYVTFSESLDPVSAQEAMHYTIPGVQVAQAVLQPDERTVALTTSPLSEEVDYVLAVEGVLDRAPVPNPIAPGSTILVMKTQGLLSRELYAGIPGYGLAELLAHPSFPAFPSERTFEPRFEAPSNIGDDYGQTMAGYLTAPLTGDYVFYLASDDASELWLGMDDDPASARKVAQLAYWLQPGLRWNDGPINVPKEQVLRGDTLFVEAEDFDFGGGRTVTDQAIGMTGPYSGGSFAGLGSEADEGLDWHDLSTGTPTPLYRPGTGVEISGVAGRDRGAFEVTVNHKLAYNSETEWRNYTREFPAGARDYWVYVHAASGGAPIAIGLEEVVSGAGTTEAVSLPRGEFRSAPPNWWDNFIHVPLTDVSGQPVRLSLSGRRTMRLVMLGGGEADLDYVAFVPATGEPPVVRPENQSAPILLEAGRRYFVRVLMKEGAGADHLAVNWRLPGGPVPINGAPAIDGVYLSSLEPNGPILITRQPVAAEVVERERVVLEVDADGTPPFGVQWYRNGEPIPGATGFRYEFEASVADHGARYHAVVSNAFSSAPTDEHVLVIASDRTPPSLDAVSGGPSLDRITLRFSEPVDPASSTHPANYTVDGGLSVLAATRTVDGRSVHLFTSPQRQATGYRVTVSGVRDMAEVPNVIAVGTVGTFTSWVQSRGYALREVYRDLPGTTLPDLLQAPKYPTDPDVIGFDPAFEVPRDVEDNYGVRLSAWLVPPRSGDYRFFFASDDAGDLLLGSDAVVADRRIAFEPSWNTARAWTSLFNRDPDFPENRSGPVFLDGQRPYAMVARMKEGGGGDHAGAAWQMPGSPEPVDGESPIPGEYLIGFVDPADPSVVVTPYLFETEPSWIAGGSEGLTVVVHGIGFLDGATVRWNGSPRPTWFLDGTRLSADLPAADLVESGAPFATANLTVVNANGAGSNPLGFAVVSAAGVGDAESRVVMPGESAGASTAPATPGLGGVAATGHNVGGEPLVVSVATYFGNPTGSPVFDVGGGFVDLAVFGADAGDAVDARFYYPVQVTGDAERALVLLWHDGTVWRPVVGSGGVTPPKDITDGLDGTVSGGRFAVRFDATSQPSVTQLSGTPFALAGGIPNLPPVVGNDEVIQLPRANLRIPVSALLANDRDPEGGSLRVVAVSSPSASGASISLSNGWITYRGNDRNAEDRFTYTVEDEQGQQATGVVTIRRR